MQKLIAIFMIALTMSACSGSRGCGCPNWGSIEMDQEQLMVLENHENIPKGFIFM